MSEDSPTPWAALPTEARHPASMGLDRLDTAGIVALLVEEDRRGIDAVLHRASEIARGSEWIAETLERGGSVVLAGAGTSGRLGVLEAAECPPTFGTDPRAIRAVMAGGDEAVFAAREGAEDRAEDGTAAARNLRPHDLLIAISASSVTPFVRAALTTARELGARSILLTCASLALAASHADLVIALDTGPEILTGSTRLKAGSATKAALNALTTAAMVRLGKVYENLMVDVRPGSAKLRDRMQRILLAATGLSRQEVANLLEAAGGELKTALVMARTGLDADAARERLRATHGHVRHALEL